MLLVDLWRGPRGLPTPPKALPWTVICGFFIYKILVYFLTCHFLRSTRVLWTISAHFWGFPGRMRSWTGADCMSDAGKYAGFVRLFRLDHATKGLKMYTIRPQFKPLFTLGVPM